MDSIKKILGIVWVALGVYVAYYIIVKLAIPKCTSGKGEDLIAGCIYFFLVPIISASLMIFGYYAVTDEYKSETAE